MIAEARQRHPDVQFVQGSFTVPPMPRGGDPRDRHEVALHPVRQRHPGFGEKRLGGGQGGALILENLDV